VSSPRVHGVESIDGVYNDIKDLDGFRAECQADFLHTQRLPRTQNTNKRSVP
jgi:hypothetical protein